MCRAFPGSIIWNNNIYEVNTLQQSLCNSVATLLDIQFSALNSSARESYQERVKPISL